MTTEATKQLVKVRYINSDGSLTEKEFTYYAEVPYCVGDDVEVPVKDSWRKARVSSVDVDPAEVESFKDKLKTIPEYALPPEPVLIEVQEVREKTEIPRALMTKLQERDLLLQEAREIQVTNEDEYTVSSALEVKLKGFIKEVDKVRDSEVRPYNEEVKRINAAFKEEMAPAVEVLNIVSGKNAAYQREQLRLQREEQARKDAIAQRAFEKKQAEEAAAKEAERVAREAEAEAIAACNTEAAEEARLAAEKAAAEAARKAPLIPVPVAPVVDTFVKSVKTDAGSNTTKVFWNFMYARNEARSPETTLIDKRFMLIDEAAIKRFVKNGIWTKDVEVKPGYWTIKECADIIIFEDVSNMSRGAKR